MKKYQYLIAVVVFVVLVLVGIGIGVKNHNHVEAKISTKDMVNRISKAVDTLYKDQDKEYLVDKVTKTDFEKISKDLETLKGSSMDNDMAVKLNTAIQEFGYAEAMFKLKNKVEALLDKNGNVVKKANVSECENLANELSLFKPKFVESIRATIEEVKTKQEPVAAAAENNTEDKTKVAETSLITEEKQNTTVQAPTVNKEQTNKNTSSTTTTKKSSSSNGNSTTTDFTDEQIQKAINDANAKDYKEKYSLISDDGCGYDSNGNPIFYDSIDEANAHNPHNHNIAISYYLDGESPQKVY